MTVITPTHNRRQLLAETVASVQMQDMPDWQMIVVDDASEDDTWDWLQGVGEPRVEPLRMEAHSERSAARNIGLGLARGEFVLFLDDDDLLPPSALARHLAAFRRHPEAVASVAARVLFAEDGTETLQRFVGEEVSRSVWEEVLLGWVAVCGVSLFRADALRSVGGWDESYVIAEDYELWSRLALKGPVVVSPDVVLRYRVHGGQWRSQNYLELMDEIRTSAVERSEGENRLRGQRALRARRLVLRTADYARRDRHMRALWAYGQALKAARGALRSPLVDSIATLNRPSLPRMVLKIFVPNFLLRRARESRVGSARGAQVAFDVQLDTESDGRYWTGAGRPAAMGAGSGEQTGTGRAREEPEL